jgi:hypothetical protein
MHRSPGLDRYRHLDLSFLKRLRSNRETVVCARLSGRPEYWRATTGASAQARRFQQTFAQAVIQMAYRLPHLETAMRNHSVTLTQVVERQTTVPELQLTKAVLRAQAYRSRLFEQYESVKDVLLP